MNRGLNQSLRGWGLAVVAGFSLFSTRAQKSPISHESLWLMKQAGSPVASPDGRWIVVPVTEPAYDEKDETSDLWLVSGDGSAPPKRLTTAKGTESSPAWSPDGTQIAFTAKREGDEASQVYILDLQGGEARRLTQLPLPARTPKWSPDGRWILFQSPFHRGATNTAANKQRVEDVKKAKSKVRVYESFPIRRWDKWLDETQTHLFVVAPQGGEAPRNLLAGSQLVSARGYRGAAGEGSGDSLEPAWSPDSASIVFTATTDADTAAYAEPSQHLYEVQLSGGEPRRLTQGTQTFSKAQFSPTGTSLAFLVNDGHGKLYALDRLGFAPWPWKGEPFKLATPHFDRSVSDFTFTPDGQSVVLNAEDSGRVSLWRTRLSDATPSPLLANPQGVWNSLQIPAKSAKPVLFGTWESSIEPAEIHRLDLDSANPVRLTSFNVDVAKGIDWQPLREFWFTNKQGRAVHSFLALPPSFDAAKKYPLFVLIHGGHALMWRDAISRRWNYHLLAQPGYVVLLTDYVGSTGYGEKFTLDILGDPLRGPANDINEAADEALRRYPFLDATRQAAGGASYGGHLANWLEATTTRYRCLISHAGLASLYSQWATSDAIYHREVMMGGPFWEKPQAWLDQSPTTYARQFKTPMLMSIGESDYRVPLNNSLEMWAVLQRQQVPSRLLVWPDENHWILKGENSRVFYKEVHEWLAKWLGQ